MKKTIFYCNRCGQEITGEIHKLLDCIADPETGHYSDKHYAFNLGTSSLDFCDSCMVEIDRELANKYLHIKADGKPKRISKELKLDMGKVRALRKAGWSLKAIAEEMGGCSPQTIANKLHDLEVEENAEGNATE